MKIKLLGTAAAEGFPGLFCNCEPCRQARQLGGKNIRRRSCAIINDSFLIDFSPDIYTQALMHNLELWNLKSLLITHTHGDHIDLEELVLRSTEYFCHIPESVKLTVYCNETVKGLIEEAIKNGSDKPLDFLIFHVLKPFEEFEVEGVRVTPLPANHSKGEESMVFLLEEDGKSFLYCNDTAYPPKETVEFLKTKELDAIGFDCTTGKTKPGKTHMNFEQNIELKNELGTAVHKDTFLYITHFSHNCLDSHEQLVQLAQPEGFSVAFDGMEVVLS